MDGCIYIYIYIYRQIERERVWEREREWKRERQTDRQRHRQTDRQTKESRVIAEINRFVCLAVISVKLISQEIIAYIANDIRMIRQGQKTFFQLFEKLWKSRPRRFLNSLIDNIFYSVKHLPLLPGRETKERNDSNISLIKNKQILIRLQQKIAQNTTWKLRPWKNWFIGN